MRIRRPVTNLLQPERLRRQAVRQEFVSSVDFSLRSRIVAD